MQIRIYIDENKWIGEYWQGTQALFFLDSSFYKNGDPSCPGTQYHDFDLTPLMMDLSKNNAVLQTILNEKSIVGCSILFSIIDWKLDNKLEENEILMSGNISVHKNDNGRVYLHGKNVLDLIKFYMYVTQTEIKPFPADWLEYNNYSAVKDFTLELAVINSTKKFQRKISGWLLFLKRSFSQLSFYIEQYFSEFGRLYHENK